MVRGRGYIKSVSRPGTHRRQGGRRHAGAAQGHRARRARPGRAARHCRAQRRRRSGERHRPATLRRQRAQRHQQRQGAAGGDCPIAAQGRRGGAGLRPLRAHLPRHRHAAPHAARGKRRGRAGVHRVPPARAQRPGRHPHAPRRHPDVVRGDEAARPRLQHHEPRRHRHRHRRHDRRRHRHDRERAQASGARAARQAPPGNPRRSGLRGRPGAVLLAAHHHRVVPADLHAGGAGRPPVRPAGLHQDVRHGGGGGAVDHAGAGADGAVRARPHHSRAQEPAQPAPHRHLSAGHPRWCCRPRR